MKEPAQNIEYIVAEEILMPEEMVRGIRIGNIDELEALAEAFKVTPSMALVRLKRIECIEKDVFEEIFESLDNKWRKTSEQKSNDGFKYNAKDITRVITYNGKLYAMEVMNLLRAGRIGSSEASRLLLFKKKSKALLNELGNQL